MNVTTKITDLKPGVNYDYNPFIRETLAYPYDFLRSVEYAIRQIGKKVRIMEKTVYIPVVKDVTLNEFTLSNLCKEKIDFVKPLRLGAIGISSDTGEVVIGNLDSEYIETVNINGITDYYRLAIRRLGEKMYFQSTLTSGTVLVGKYDTIATVSANKITIGTFGNATAGYYIINLSKSDALQYNYRKITTLSSPDVNLDSDPVGDWVAGDKIYIVNGLPELLIVLFQAVTSAGYFDSETTIPVPDQILDDLDHLCYNYLYDILGTRDPNLLKLYAAKINAGTLMKESDVINEIKKRINSMPSVVVIDSYNSIFNTTYDR